MSRRRWLTACAGLLLVVLAAAAMVLSPPAPDPRDIRLEGDVDRGAYVARLSGCIGCHTDPDSGRGALAGGAGIVTAFGTFHAPNITPHPTDGIGGWSLSDFARALTAGVAPDGRHYYPSFPYPFYTRLSDQQIADLWAAVRSVPAVAGRAPAHDLPAPFRIRWTLAIWKRLNFSLDPSPPAPGRSDAWRRGRLLARGPAHCGACHTPRNLLGGRSTARRFEGGVGPGEDKTPAITPEALTKAGWTREDLVYALRTGLKSDGDSFGGSMAEVVRGGTRFWTDEDLTAIVAYLFDSDADE